MAQSIKQARAGLYAACQSIYASSTGPDGSPVLVTLGHPGMNVPAALVAVAMTTQQPVTQPTMGPNRTRQKDVEFGVIISVWSGGTEAVQQTVIEAVDDLSELLESYFRTAGNETLGGGCFASWVSNIEGPTPDVTVDPSSGAASGRQAESLVTVTARIRQ